MLLAVNAADTGWVLLSSGLVLLTTLGLAFFYGGLVREKNVLSTIGQVFFILALVSGQWVLWGYSFAFGPDRWGMIGGLDWVGMRGVTTTPHWFYEPTIPHQLHMFFEMMFAVIAAALLSGAFVERTSFKTVIVFSLLWTTLVYDPIAHWEWALGGWMGHLKVLDFAGGTVVHISTGVSALVATWVLGPRLDAGERSTPHDITMALLGVAIVWFGWFGFTGGNALVSDGSAVNTVIATNISAAMGMLTWLTVSYIRRRQPSIIGGALGAVAGLVAITPAAGFVTPVAAIPIGLGAEVFCYVAVRLKHWLPADDPLDAWPIHAVGGIWGAVATGLFASAAVNATGGNGLLAGNPGQLLTQIAGIVVVVLYAGAMTWLILKLLGLFVTLRVVGAEEELGLDVSQHGETAYGFYQGLTRRLLTAREEERRRVAYEVHDGLAQMVTSAHQHLQAFAHQHPADSPEAQTKLAHIADLAQGTVRETRRLIADLRPPVLDDFGLGSAIRMLVADLQAEGWEITFHDALGDDRLPSAEEEALFGVTREALANVRKHARTTKVRVSLEHHGRCIRLQVQDFGRGFSPGSINGAASIHGHIGLLSMRERVGDLGGRLTIQSSVGHGTLIVAEVPFSHARQS